MINSTSTGTDSHRRNGSGAAGTVNQRSRAVSRTVERAPFGIRSQPKRNASVATDDPAPADVVPLRVLTVTAPLPTPDYPRPTAFIKRQVDFLRQAGIDVEILDFTGGRRPWRYLWNWIRFHFRVTFRYYDLVHAQFGQNGLIALPRRLPLVVTFRGSDVMGIVGKRGRNILVGRVLQAVSRFVAKHADATVVVSEHMKAYLPTSISPVVIPSGLDLRLLRQHPRDEARRRLGMPAHEHLVLFAGNPERAIKRYRLAHDAVAILNRRIPARLVVAWGVPHEQIPLYMSACDALVFTSVQEGSPNVVKEALACNLPVVSVRVGDVEQRLTGIDGCELCPDDRAETIAAALERVLRRGRRIDGRLAVEPLDETLLTQKLIAIYRSIVPPVLPARQDVQDVKQ